MGNGNKVAASKDTSAISTLTTLMVRLPLGHAAVDQSKSNSTAFHFFIPTDAGGELFLMLERDVLAKEDKAAKVEMTLFANDGTTVIVKRTTAPSIRHRFAPSTKEKPTHGRYYLLVKGPSPRRVECTFTQEEHARDGKSDKDPPLIPWNFYFWPSARVFLDGKDNPTLKRMEFALMKHALAYGKDLLAGVLWENLNHISAKGPSWHGHCNLSARASILFEQPIATTLISPEPKSSDVPFDEDEIEYLAAEWFGHWAQSHVDFDADDVKKNGIPWGEDNTFIDNNGNEIVQKARFPDQFWHRFLKPSDLELSNKEFTQALKQAILAHDPNVGSAVDGLASSVLRIRTLVKEWFGQTAAKFYQTLVDKMYHEKHALVSDLRGDGAGNSPLEVWNHAVFDFRASFMEILPMDRESLENEDFMVIEVTLAANKDYPVLPSKGLPADEIDGGGIDVRDVASRRSFHVLKIAFDASTGKVKLDDTKNRWVHCRNNKHGDELYIPAGLVSVLPAGVTLQTAQENKPDPKKPEPSSLGNVTLGLELVKGPQALLTVRKRYSK